MNRVEIALENCYGIERLETTFDFLNTQAYAIYAPNGVMKSSLAQTFQDAADGTQPRDRFFPKRETSCRITDENGLEVGGERVFVVPPYDAEFGPSEKTSTLLVDAGLRQQYTDLLADVDAAKKVLLNEVQQRAQCLRNFEKEIVAAITRGGNFRQAILRLKTELAEQDDAPFENVAYDIVFNEKVTKAFKNNKEIEAALEDYVLRYNELLARSTFFKRGVLDYYNAGEIAKTLTKSGFFEASHTVNLKAAGETFEISTQEELEAVIAKEKAAILEDEALRAKFDTMSTKLERNAELRAFCRYMQEHAPLLSRMVDLGKFKEDVLKSYLKAAGSAYNALIAQYESTAQRLREIEEEARRQETELGMVIAMFNERFFVPFKLEARNREEVIIGNAPVVELGYRFFDRNEDVEVEKEDLLKVLSTGERKALYILNVLFEIQRRRKDDVETLVVIDDIADSFDYQNTYAIIHYLAEISRDGLFKLVILTHNFDFFRTLNNRGIAGYKHCLTATRAEHEVSLDPASGIRNVFAHDFRGRFFTDPKKKIASIPFLRNLVEMIGGNEGNNYRRLTSMFHLKADSDAATVGVLDDVFKAVCSLEGQSDNASTPVCDLIRSEAQTCLKDGGWLNLEDKIVLSIAIRLAAERFIIDKIQDDEFVEKIASRQTQVLIKEFKKRFPEDANAGKVLDRVALMTPENIHVNAFMYEPIVDMSGEHLKKLYTDVLSLGG